MSNAISTFSSARMLALITSTFGLALLAVLYAAASRDGSPSLIVYGLFTLPFLLVLGISIAPVEPAIRATFIWIASSAAVPVAALTIFSGAGFFFAAIILAWLFAAWHEGRGA